MCCTLYIIKNNEQKYQLLKIGSDKESNKAKYFIKSQTNAPFLKLIGAFWYTTSPKKESLYSSLINSDKIDTWSVLLLLDISSTFFSKKKVDNIPLIRLTINLI